MYKRVLLKLSGEQLSGKFEAGIDPDVVSWLAQEVKKVITLGCQMILVVGGGNMVRGVEVAGKGIRRVTGDHMGMLSSLINSMAMTDIFEASGLPTRCLSNIYADQVAEPYSYRRADKHLSNGRVVILAGGIGRPFFTHDTAAVNLALELECDIVMKATKVDGVYDKDPAKHSDAKRLESIAYQQALEDPEIKVMDKAALGLAMEHSMPLVIFELMKDDNISRVIKGEPIGTKITA